MQVPKSEWTNIWEDSVVLFCEGDITMQGYSKVTKMCKT